MSRNLLLTLRFDGTAYHGWQWQSNAISVQQRITEAAQSVFCEPIKIHGCSRTDAGVHARMFCCNFHADKEIPVDKIPAALNAYLPRDISVYQAEERAQDFHARYSCIKKEYVYCICNTKYRDPFLENRAHFYRYPLAVHDLHDAAQAFVGTHDFSSFCSSGSSVEQKIRTISEFSVTRNGELVLFRVSADGFLYNMVRIMVGTLLDVAEKKFFARDIPNIITAKNREAAGITAPPQGLYLNKVFY